MFARSLGKEKIKFFFWSIAMNSVIEIEWIGNNIDKKMMSMGEKAIRRPWVAELELCRKGFTRRFVKGALDYSRANSEGSRGIFVEFILRRGVYECFGPESWSESGRFYVRSENGIAKKGKLEDALKWLSEGLG